MIMGTFTLDLREYAKKTGAKMDTLVREVVIGVGERIIERSPVGNPSLWQSPPPAGYVGGRFRANWQHQFASPPDGVLDAVDKTPATSLNRVVASVQAAPGAGVHYLANNLPYAHRLEDGWSTQAPAGMVGLAVADFRGIVRDEIARMQA